MIVKRTLFTFLTMALIVAASTGCAQSPQMGKYSYRVSLDSALKDPNTNIIPSVEVDFVGVSEAELDRWQSQDIDAYFSPGNVLRANADRFTMSFNNARSEPQVLTDTDPIWQKWQRSGAQQMFIMASIPRPAGTSGVDPRRLILPLDKARWTSNVIDILVKRSGVTLQTAMRPEKK